MLFVLLFLFVRYSTSFVELFTLDCQRRIHVTPTLPTSSGFDLSGPLGIINEAFNEMYQEAQQLCPDMLDDEFNNRFGITLPQGFIRLFELDKFEEEPCTEKYVQEIRVFYDYIKALLPEDPLPSTCNHETADDGICNFLIELEPFTLLFSIETCPTYSGEESYNRIPFISVACDGCDTLMKPCTADGDCKEGEKCLLYNQFLNKFLVWYMNETLDGGLVLNEEEFYDYGFFDDLLQRTFKADDLVTAFFHSMAEGYWKSGFEGTYSALTFCLPDIDGDDLFLKMYNIEDCEPAYCDGVLFSEDHVCSGHGFCSNVGETTACECFEGYVGQICEIAIGVEELMYCNEVFDKDPLVCSAHGDCVDTVCECFEGYAGDDCERPAECYGSALGEACGTGLCVADGVCVCPEGYYTADESAPCAGLLFCHGMEYLSNTWSCGQGECVFNDDGMNGICECDFGWTGATCTTTVYCNGIIFHSSEVCDKHGECVADDTCVCEQGYEGVDCELDRTFCSIDGSDTTTCYGHGICKWESDADRYECDCFLGWYSTETFCLEPANCFGIYGTLEESCGEFGTCVAPDVCECQTDWKGLECDEPRMCGDVPAYDKENVCSGYGTCTIDEKCVCDDFHWGEFCQYDAVCGGYQYDDPVVCGGTGVCMIIEDGSEGGCRLMNDEWEDPDTQCTTEVLQIFGCWDGVLENEIGEDIMVNSPSRKNGQYFKTQINRIRMEYNEDSPIPLFVYNGDGVFTVLPSHKYLGFAAYFQEFDRLLVLLDELFGTLRELHTDITDVIQQYYYKIWDPLPWLFRFTTFNAENHLGWRAHHFERNVARFLGAYKLPKWFKLIEPPMTCSLQQYRDFGNCTLRITSFGKYFGGELEFFVKIRRDEKSNEFDHTGLPHVEVWCDGALCHEMYNLKRCEDNYDCDSKHCKTILQTRDYRLPNYVTTHSISEIVEDDGTSFHYSMWNFTALFFQGGMFKLYADSSLVHPLTFYKNIIAFIAGRPDETEVSDELNICTIDRKEYMLPRHGVFRFFWGQPWWVKMKQFCRGLVTFDKIEDFWQKRKKWWKSGGKWWKDFMDDKDDKDDRDDNKDDSNDDGRRGAFWRNWWKKKWKKKDKKKKKDKEYVMKISGLESWNELFCMKRGGDCGCEEINCVCYEFSNEECESYFSTPQEEVYVVPGVKYVPQDDDENPEDPIPTPNSEDPNSSALLTVGILFFFCLFL